MESPTSRKTEGSCMILTYLPTYQNRQMMVDALFYYSSYYYTDDLSPLTLLLELGVDLNSEDAEGIAAIHTAIRSGGHNKIVQFFIDNKADLSKKNKQGRIAAEILR
jgi:ankyrin repeat protein